jgi:hypothetical protein
MNKLETIFAVILGLVLVAVLTWGIAKATQDLTQVVAQEIGNISTQVE